MMLTLYSVKLRSPASTPSDTYAPRARPELLIYFCVRTIVSSDPRFTQGRIYP